MATLTLSALSVQFGYVEQQIIALAKQVQQHQQAGDMPKLCATGARDVLGHAQLSLAHAAEWVRMAGVEVQRSRPKAPLTPPPQAPLTPDEQLRQVEARA